MLLGFFWISLLWFLKKIFNASVRHAVLVYVYLISINFLLPNLSVTM